MGIVCSSNFLNRVFFQFLKTYLHSLVVESKEKASVPAVEFAKFVEKGEYWLVIALRISSWTVSSAVDLESAEDITEDFDVYETVLSFAREGRAYIERVAEYLRGPGVLYFYDRYEDVVL